MYYKLNLIILIIFKIINSIKYNLKFITKIIIIKLTHLSNGDDLIFIIYYLIYITLIYITLIYITLIYITLIHLNYLSIYSLIIITQIIYNL
jgi:hypothetical protein